MDRNAHWYKLNNDFGISINEIALNPLHNPDKVSQQRVHQVVSEHRRNLETKRNKDYNHTIS